MCSTPPSPLPIRLSRSRAPERVLRVRAAWARPRADGGGPELALPLRPVEPGSGSRTQGGQVAGLRQPRDFDRARDAAKAADAALARGGTGPLLGVPMTVKESFNVAGLPTTWGIPQAQGFRARDDALIVARVRGAGAVILGKTNVPLVLGDWQSYNEIHGVTRNPWDLERTPGGSSGGSAAALAAGFGPLSLGSDIGGSLRVPAHFCGVAALKPTHGLVPSRGQVPPGAPALPREPDLAVVGPMARTVDDLARLFDVIAGPDEQGLGVGYRLALRPPRQGALKDYRVLLLDSHPMAPTAQAIRQALDRLGGPPRTVRRACAAQPPAAARPGRRGTHLRAAADVVHGRVLAATGLRAVPRRDGGHPRRRPQPGRRTRARHRAQPPRLGGGRQRACHAPAAVRLAVRAGRRGALPCDGGHRLPA